MTGTYVGSWRVFVTLDGMGGPGSPPRRHLHQDLTAAGYTVHVTAQPSDDRLGEIARHGTDIYTGTPSPAWWPPTATTTSPGNPSAARGWPNRAM